MGEFFDKIFSDLLELDHKCKLVADQIEFTKLKIVDNHREINAISENKNKIIEKNIQLVIFCIFYAKSFDF